MSFSMTSTKLLSAMPHDLQRSKFRFVLNRFLAEVERRKALALETFRSKSSGCRCITEAKPTIEATDACS